MYQGSGKGGTLCPPPQISLGLGRARAPILFGNDLPRSDLSYTKGFMKFGCPEPSKIRFDFEIFVGGEAFDSVFTGPAL